MSKETGVELPKRKRNPEEGELDITPMIDVTFLLLAFFVVVSKMDPQAAVALPVASYGDSVSEKSAVIMIVTPDESGNGYYIFKGRSKDEDIKVQSTEEDVQETEIGEYIENELSAFPEKDSSIIKAEGDVKTLAVEVCKRGIAQSTLAESRTIYVGVEEAK
jgi:biopolymer transport protein TolR